MILKTVLQIGMIMTCEDLIKIIESENVKDADIFYVDLDYDQETGYLSLGRNYKILPYPEFKDLYTGLTAEEYDQITIKFDIENGKVISRTEDHYNTSSEQYYPY